MKIEPDFKPTRKDEIGRNRPAIARCTGKTRRSREPRPVHLPPRIMSKAAASEGGDASRLEPLVLTMRKMLLLGIAALLSVVAVSAWSGPRPTQAEITTSGIDTFVLMRNSSILEVQQYDAF